MSPLEAIAAETGETSTSEPIISVTPEALDHLRELRDDEVDGDKLGLRLAIASDAGEDFRYDLSFEEYLTAAFADQVRTHDGMKVIIPGDDVALLTGATLDYTSTQGLVIRNPNRPMAPSVEGLTADDELSAEIDALVASEVNPALAAHGGFVTYVGHDGEGTAYLTMGGGCHGCSMSKRFPSGGGFVVRFASSSRRVRLVAGASLLVAGSSSASLPPRAAPARRWRFPRRRV